MTNNRLFKWKDFADDNFKFNESGRKFSKRVGNSMVKEKLLDTSNFSFSRIVFKRLVLQTLENEVLFWIGLNLPLLTHYQTTSFRLFQTERVCRQQFQI